MSEVESWFSDFSRGKGADGQNMYDRCSGQCSPQYEFFIADANGKLALDADVRNLLGSLPVGRRVRGTRSSRRFRPCVPPREARCEPPIVYPGRSDRSRR